MSEILKKEGDFAFCVLWGDGYLYSATLIRGVWIALTRPNDNPVGVIHKSHGYQRGLGPPIVSPTPDWLISRSNTF
jgi:hypothetical protein